MFSYSVHSTFSEMKGLSMVVTNYCRGHGTVPAVSIIIMLSGTCTLVVIHPSTCREEHTALFLQPAPLLSGIGAGFIVGSVGVIGGRCTTGSSGEIAVIVNQ